VSAAVIFWPIMLIGILWGRRLRIVRRGRETDVFTIVERSSRTYNQRQFQRFLEERGYGKN
jgi:hypothetical protein